MKIIAYKTEIYLSISISAYNKDKIVFCVCFSIFNAINCVYLKMICTFAEM